MTNTRTLLAALLATLLSLTGAVAARAADPLKVCATTPDLGDLARQIGGDHIAVTVFVKGTEDPHFLEAKPSFIKSASDADALIEVGLELEQGWLPAILKNCRNDRIQPGQPGAIDASVAIAPMDVPAGTIDRSMGDVHAMGNPHYLTDPVNGLKVARLLADRFSQLRPDERSVFEQNYTAFRAKLGAALVGEALAKKYDAEKLATLFERGRLRSFLESQGDAKLLSGWLGQLADAGATKAIADHNLWPYFARRYGVTVEGFLEPKPGVAPTTKHLGEIVDRMKRDDVKVILTSPYFDPRHARFVADQTGARIVALTHQCGGQPNTDDYLSMCDYNVRQLVEATKGGH